MSRLHGFTSSKRYAAFRQFIFDRDQWRCRECGRPGALELHHVRPLASGGKVWDAANCQTLCRSCHITLTGRSNKRALNPTEKRWAALVDALADTVK